MTLDTVSVYVTTYNGTNQTAITSKTTIYGDIATINASTVAEAQSISSYLVAAVIEYEGGGPLYLARGSDGAIGSTTSIPWPTPFIKISTAVYTSSTSYPDQELCPSGLQLAAGGYPSPSTCICAMTSYWPIDPPDGLTTTSIGFPSAFYYPINATAFNWNVIARGGMDEFAMLDMEVYSSWLVAQPWATALFPNLRQCAFVDLPQGPPGVKIPVSALTTTATSYVSGAIQMAPTPKPADTVAHPHPAST